MKRGEGLEWGIVNKENEERRWDGLAMGRRKERNGVFVLNSAMREGGGSGDKRGEVGVQKMKSRFGEGSADKVSSVKGECRGRRK